MVPQRNDNLSQPTATQQYETAEPNQTSLGGGVYIGRPAGRPVLRRAVVLGPGPVTALCPLSAIRPPHLWPIGNQSRLVRQLEALRDWGIGSTLLCGARAMSGDDVQALCGEMPGMGLSVQVESEPRGTAGALRALADLADDENVLVMTGTTDMAELDPGALFELHLRRRAVATILVRRQPQHAVDQVRFAPGGRVESVVVHALGDRADACWTSAGAWILSAAALRCVPQTGYFSIREQLVPSLVGAGANVYAVPLEIAAAGDPIREYLSSHHRGLSAGRRPGPHYRRLAPGVWAAPGIELASGVVLDGPLVMGAGCRVEAGATLRGPVSIGDHCHIGRGATVSRSILWQGVEIGDGAALADCVVTDNSHIPPRARLERVTVVDRRSCDGQTRLLRHVAPPGQRVLLASRGRRLTDAANPGLGRWVAALVGRLLDVVLAAMVLVLTAPVMLVAALMIRLDSAGPVLFRQQRCGKDGQPFTMLKLRTMVSDAPLRQASLRRTNEVDGPMFKMRRDPRVTRVGALLRTTCIDELPQMLNVLSGQMSMVGPRPLAPEEMTLAPAWRDLRLKVKPGVTGLWQVRGRSRPAFADWIRYDIQYVAGQSLGMDLRILATTVVLVLRRLIACHGVQTDQGQSSEDRAAVNPDGRDAQGRT